MTQSGVGEGGTSLRSQHALPGFQSHTHSSGHESPTNGLGKTGYKMVTSKLSPQLLLQVAQQYVVFFVMNQKNFITSLAT